MNPRTWDSWDWACFGIGLVVAFILAVMIGLW